jgi:hypothetical protein
MSSNPRPLGSVRHLVILTEGQFASHNAKTAMGVIRYGRDEIVAIVDSTLAGRNLSEFVPGRDVPSVGSGFAFGRRSPLAPMIERFLRLVLGSPSQHCPWPRPLRGPGVIGILE